MDFNYEFAHVQEVINQLTALFMRTPELRNVELKYRKNWVANVLQKREYG